MTNLDKLLTDFKEARSAATPYEETYDSNCPECGLQTFGYRHWNGCNLMDKHRVWETLAANNSDKLIKIIEVMKLQLENIKEIQEHLGGDSVLLDDVNEALQQAEKIAGE